MRILSYGLFGQKRYKNLYLSCSLNCFYWALTIANALHQRVAGLALIIKFDVVHVIEYFAEEFEGKTYRDKKYTKINIKLTKSPTEDDKKEPGYNPGLSAADITEPLTEVVSRGRGEENNKGERPERRNNRRYDRNNQRRYDRGERGDRGDRGERTDRRDRAPREDRNERRYEGRNEQGRNRRGYRNQRDQGYRNRDKDDRYRGEDKNREQKNIKKEYEPKRREERNQRRYGDDRDERRQYRAGDNLNNSAQNAGNKDNTYPRGERKTRGGAIAKPRGENSRNQQSDNYPRRDRQEGARYESRRDRGGEDRGERGPKKNRYSDDDD